MSLNKQHTAFESAVLKWLNENGFHSTSATYHDVMKKETVDFLHLRFTPTALYVRGRADRMVFHKKHMIDFEVECKTHINPNRDDMLIEMLPLAHHLSKVSLGVDCLYAYQDMKGREYGFWCSEIPKIKVIFIPSRWNKNLLPFFQNVASKIFPEIEVVTDIHVGGSGDPFLIISRKTLDSLPDWKNLVLDKIILKQ